MKTDIKACTTSLPSTNEMLERMSSLDGTSAAHTRDLGQFLANAAAKLHPLSGEVLSSLERMGGDAPSEVPLSGCLKEYSPVFADSTRAAGRDVLDSLKADGFDRVEDLLLYGELSEFFNASVDTASRVANFGLSSRFFSNAVSIRSAPTTRTR